MLAWDVQAIAETTSGFVMAQRTKDHGKGASHTLRFTLVTHVPPFGALATNDGEVGPGSWQAAVRDASFVAWGGNDRALCQRPDGSYLVARDRGEPTPVEGAGSLVLHGFPASLGAALVASRGAELLLLPDGKSPTPFARMRANIVRITVSIDGLHFAVEDEAGQITVFNASAEPVLELLRASS